MCQVTGAPRLHSLWPSRNGSADERRAETPRACDRIVPRKERWSTRKDGDRDRFCLESNKSRPLNKLDLEVIDARVKLDLSMAHKIACVCSYPFCGRAKLCGLATLLCVAAAAAAAAARTPFIPFVDPVMTERGHAGWVRWSSNVSAGLGSWLDRLSRCLKSGGILSLSPGSDRVDVGARSSAAVAHILLKSTPLQAPALPIPPRPRHFSRRVSDRFRWASSVGCGCVLRSAHGGNADRREMGEPC